MMDNRFVGELDTENPTLTQWELAPNITVTVDVKTYQKYDAAECVIYHFDLIL